MNEKEKYPYTGEDWKCSALSVRIMLIGWVTIAAVAVIVGLWSPLPLQFGAGIVLAIAGAALNLVVGTRQKKYSRFFFLMMVFALIACVLVLSSNALEAYPLWGGLLGILQSVAQLALCWAMWRGFDAQLFEIRHSVRPREIGQKMMIWSAATYVVLALLTLVETIIVCMQISESLMLWVLFAFFSLAFMVSGIGAVIYQIRFLMHTGRYFTLQARRMK